MRDKARMWLHYCWRDHGWYSVAATEECQWCGGTESAQGDQIAEVRLPSSFQLDREFANFFVSGLTHSSPETPRWCWAYRDGAPILA